MSQFTSTQIASRLSAILLVLFWGHLAALFFVNQWTEFFGHWMAALVVLLGFTGTVKRHTGLLLFYFIVQLFWLIILPIAIIAFAVILVAVIAANAHPMNPDSSYRQDPSYPPIPPATNVIVDARPATIFDNIPIFNILIFVGALIVFILEVWSTILAYKLRKQIFIERTEQREMETLVSNNDAVVPEAQVTPGEFEMKQQNFTIQDGQVPVPFYPYGASPVLVQPDLNGTPVYFYPVPYPVQQTQQ